MNVANGDNEIDTEGSRAKISLANVAMNVSHGFNKVVNGGTTRVSLSHVNMSTAFGENIVSGGTGFHSITASDCKFTATGGFAGSDIGVEGGTATISLRRDTMTATGTGGFNIVTVNGGISVISLSDVTMTAGDGTVSTASTNSVKSGGSSQPALCFPTSA